MIRKSAGRSGATKVQLAERSGGRNHILEHVGTARSEAELAVLMDRHGNGCGRGRAPLMWSWLWRPLRGARV